MASVRMLTVLLLLVFATVDGGRKSLDRIVIHVPYKIHKHHHTHTKYKIITIPSPKKEHTVIYFKNQAQPIIKETPEPHLHSDITKTPLEVPEVISPPHQQLTHSFMASMDHLKIQNPNHSDQQQEYSIISVDQKPFNTSSFAPNLTKTPRHFSSHNNLIYNYPFKALRFLPHIAFPSNFFVNPAAHQPFDGLLPKFTSLTTAHPQGHSFHPYTTKAQLSNLQVLPDSIGHTSNQVQKTGLKATPYKVKEENQEMMPMKFANHQEILTAITVPSLNSRRKGKTYVHLGHNQLKNSNNLPVNHDYEYEHVGYLIIDGNSRKIVGKNFKDELPMYSSDLL